MQFSASLTNSTYSDEEIKQAIASSSQELSNQLHPNYFIYQGSDKIRFGDLSVAEQEAIKKALSERTKENLVKYQL